MAGVGATVTVELYLNGAWVNITADCRVDPGVTIDYGIKGETGTADPSRATVYVNNGTGKYTPKNAEGPYYGLLKRNTPLRVKVGSAVRYIGEVSEFPPRWDASEADAYMPLVASGVLRRLLRGKALRSTLNAYLSGAAHVTGYWPMEDVEGSSSFASAIAGGSPMYFIGTPDLAAYDPGPSSGPIPTFNLAGAGGTANAVTPGATSFTVAFMLYIPAAGTLDTAVLVRTYTNSPYAAIYDIRYRTGGLLELVVYDVFGGVKYLSGAVNFLMLDAARMIVLDVTYNSGTGNIDYAFSATGVGTSLASIVGAPLSVTAPAVVYVDPNLNLTGSVAIGHVALADVSLAFSNANFDQAVSAFAGETVEARMARIAANNGITINVASDTSPGFAPSQYLGPQQDGTPLEVLRMAEAADVGGILTDALDVAGTALNYITRRARYNDDLNNGGAAVVVLDYAAGHISPPLEPTDDDRLLTNDATVTRIAGSSARYVDTTSPLSANQPPSGVGPYQVSPSLNLYRDTQLPDVASWLVFLGTLDETRFPQVTVDLVKNPSLVTQINAIRPGHRLVLTNLPDMSGTFSAELHVLGWTEQVGSHQRSITFNCVPSDVHDVVRLDDTRWGRLDSASTVTNGALTTTATAVPYTGDTWITTVSHPAEFPFDIVIGGELMRVTSATGTTFTVIRSRNNVVKTHLAGVSIRLAEPNRLAL